MNEFPITLQQAKELSRQKIGRLPRAGYEFIAGAVYSDDRMDYRLALINISGRLSLYAWQRPFVYVDMSKFTTVIK